VVVKKFGLLLLSCLFASVAFGGGSGGHHFSETVPFAYSDGCCGFGLDDDECFDCLVQPLQHYLVAAGCPVELPVSSHSVEEAVARVAITPYAPPSGLPLRAPPAIV